MNTHLEQLALRIHGLPIPQGSKVANRFGAGVRDANATRLKAWRKHVTAQARHQLLFIEGLPISGPVRVWIRFTFDRPSSHYGTGRNAHTLRANAPTYPGQKCGDVDKLERAILDALTDAGLWADDTQVVDLRGRKMYAGDDELALDRAGVDIIIESLARPEQVLL